MKKLLLYLMVAVVLGVLTIMVPLISLASLVRQEIHLQESNFLGELSRLEGHYGLDTSGSYVSDFTVLMVSFVLSLTLYLFVRHRMPSGDNDAVRISSY